jgi:hypothetical protein
VVVGVLEAAVGDSAVSVAAALAAVAPPVAGEIKKIKE